MVKLCKLCAKRASKNNPLFASLEKLKLVETKKPADNQQVLSGPTWARTRDFLIMSQIL